MVVNEQMVDNFEFFNNHEINTLAEAEVIDDEEADEEGFIPSAYYESENFITRDEHYTLSYDFGYDLISMLHPTRQPQNSIESQINSTPPVDVKVDDNRLYALVAFAISWFMAVLNGSSVYMASRVLRSMYYQNGKSTITFF